MVVVVVLYLLPVLIRSSTVVLQLLCVPIGGRHFGSRPALEALKETLRTFCASPALMPKYVVFPPLICFNSCFCFFLIFAA